MYRRDGRCVGEGSSSSTSISMVNMTSCMVNMVNTRTISPHYSFHFTHRGQDPALFVDDDDTPWLYWGLGGAAYVARVCMCSCLFVCVCVCMDLYMDTSVYVIVHL